MSTDRMWEFGSLVFILDFYPGTLFYAALLGVLETSMGIVAGPYLGHFIDTNDRLHGIFLIFG